MSLRVQSDEAATRKIFTEFIVLLIRCKLYTLLNYRYNFYNDFKRGAIGLEIVHDIMRRERGRTLW